MSKEISVDDIDDRGWIDLSIEERDGEKIIAVCVPKGVWASCYITVDDFRKLSAFVESEFKE